MENIGAKLILQHDMNDHPKAFLESLFASYHDREKNVFRTADYDPSEEITLTPQDYPFVKEKTVTTLGSLFFNRYVLEMSGVLKFCGYRNDTWTAKSIESLDMDIGELIMDDIIDGKMFGQYIDRRDTLGFWCASFMAASITPALLLPMEDVDSMKTKLIKEHEAAIQNGTPVQQIMAINQIESKLMSMVRNNLKDDYGYDNYASGVSNLDNNYKTINVMKGAVFNDTKQRYELVSASLMNGVEKKDIPAFSNFVTAAAYPSAVDTAKAGEMSKIVLALLQSEYLNSDPKSDCGTRSTIPVEVTKKNAKYLLYRNIDVNGKVVLLTRKNVNDYVGHYVNLYSPQCCANDAICAKCAGTIFYKMGVLRAGLLTTQITQKMLNIKLKSKHDLSQSAGIIPERYVFEQPNDFCTIEDGILKTKTNMQIIIPRILEEISGFVRQGDMVSCMGVLPVKFFDNAGNLKLSTFMSIPSVLIFRVYEDLQEDLENYIINYQPGSEICSLGIQKTVTNVELFINQVYLRSRTPQIPYNKMTDYAFRCMIMNEIDLTGPSITYELLARRVCRNASGKSFAFSYGKDPNVDQLSYVKQSFLTAVQDAGILQGLLFRDIGKAITKGLSNTIKGIEPEASPLEMVIKA